MEMDPTPQDKRVGMIAGKFIHVHRWFDYLPSKTDFPEKLVVCMSSRSLITH